MASVVDCIEEHQLEEVVLVGHSFGGTVVQKVVEELPGRIARTVFLDALILNDNQCVFDLLPDVFLEALKPKNGSHPAAAGSDETVQYPRSCSHGRPGVTISCKTRSKNMPG